MPTNEAFTYLLSIITMGLGWWLRMTWEAQKDLRRDLSEIERALPETYIRRDDFRDAVKSINETLLRIENKLDGKVDKA